MCVKCPVHRKFWIPGASIFTMMNLKHTQRRQGRTILSSAPRARGVVRGTVPWATPQGVSWCHGPDSPRGCGLERGACTPLFQLGFWMGMPPPPALGSWSGEHQALGLGV